MGWDEQQAWGEARGLWEREAMWCPRLVARKRCIRYHLSDQSRRDGKRCTCEEPAIAELKDHYRVWHQARAGYVLTTDPYNGTEERIQAFREVVENLGLTLRVLREDIWAEGVPTLVITLPDATDELLNL